MQTQVIEVGGQFHVTMTNPQGPWLIGKGLTGRAFKIFQTSSTTVEVSPPGKGQTATATVVADICDNDPTFDVELSDCESNDAKNPKVWRCAGNSSIALCGQAPKTSLQLLVAPGLFDTGGTYDAGPDAKYTLACGRDPFGNLHAASASYKCAHGVFVNTAYKTDPDYTHYWSFVPGTSEFQTCTRAARADYTGLGYSNTHPGTRIDLFLADGGAPQTDCEGGMCLEARWKESGAACISHFRWDDDGGASAPVRGQPVVSIPKCVPALDGGEILTSRSKYHSNYDGGCDDDMEGGTCAHDCDAGEYNDPVPQNACRPPQQQQQYPVTAGNQGN